MSGNCCQFGKDDEVCDHCLHVATPFEASPGLCSPFCAGDGPQPQGLGQVVCLFATHDTRRFLLDGLSYPSEAFANCHILTALPTFSATTAKKPAFHVHEKRRSSLGLLAGILVRRRPDR